MKLFKIENYSTAKIILIIALIIIITPVILTHISIFKLWGESGQIGDTIGGITSPFINGFAAVLVFIAFKEQLKANEKLTESNELLKNQEKSKIILDQIANIQNDNVKIEEVIRATINRIGIFQDSFDPQNSTFLNKITYFITEIKLTNFLIEEYTGDKDFLYKKLYYLYTIRLSNSLNSLIKEFNPPFFYHTDYKIYISDILLEVQGLNASFSDVDKYKNK